MANTYAAQQLFYQFLKSTCCSFVDAKMTQIYLDIGVKGPRDDGEYHVDDGEDGREPEQFHILIKSFFDVLKVTFCIL